jgi:RNA polymerase sigma factor (sigma-70 family)
MEPNAAVPPDPQESVPSLELVREWCAGDEQAAARLHDRYAGRLVRLVAGRLGARFRTRFGPEDVVQSALGSVLVGAREGQYRFREGEPLWPFLVAFTLNKLRNRVRAQLRLGRSVARECGGDELLAALEARAADPGAGLEEAEELAALLEEVRSGLPEERHRQILDLALAGLGPEAIAGETARSERTVRRVLAGVREHLERRLADPGP